MLWADQALADERRDLDSHFASLQDSGDKST